jgi:UDP-N-acetylmuramoyl-tripeptide--D-alanyl-D-alanine ligase
MKLADIAAATGGRLVGASPQETVRSVSTDTRTLRPGELFVALVGERFDGHGFIAQALAKRAVAVVVEEARVPRGVACRPAIVVGDTTRALQDVARANRARSRCTVLAVTGSNGKTTTKDFIATLAGRHLETVSSEGSFNNHVGVPLTLLRISSSTRLAVVEIGMSAAGEIRALAAVAQPEVGVITNVNPAHLEFFDSVAAIADAKAELVESLPPDGTAVLNADDAWVRQIGERWTARRIMYGTSPEADVQLSILDETASGSEVRLRCFDGPEIEAVIPAPGRHNALNAAAAVAACCAVGLEPAAVIEGFAALQLPKMRFERRECGGVLVINDAYNANPESMRAALETFAAMPVEGRRVVVLGEMRELGDQSLAAHREVGRRVARHGFARLVTTGGYARRIAEAAIEHGMPARCVTTCNGTQDATKRLRDELRPGDAVLIKGSRAVGMERIVEGLTAAGGRAPGRTPSRT